MNKMIVFLRYITGLLLIVCNLCQGASSVLVWPVYPVIEADQSGVPLWLENRGTSSVTLQIRVLAWRQQGMQDRYSDQTSAVASPPFATISPGKRQLVRLMRVSPVAAGREESYRIIIDELPSPEQEQKTNEVGLKLQMRYLLPLFIDGPGIWTKPRSDKAERDPATATRPILSWHTENGFLVVRNSGIVHARLTHVFWGDTPQDTRPALSVASGLLGYILPGQEMKWPLPSGRTVPVGKTLYAQLADNTLPVAIASSR
ncbi:molecular chaperone [Klebsiella variicola]|uniref:fimbrial biogenesis chaperone n=1 Tax=Klebsiella variicola TaxID=244366 RepID=UPI001648B05B|nr:molecular chaperone [Klebsiella variicola]MBC4035251.1 molecular chaperone [Klebsiella pneumoniae]MBC5038354.1 molecular chaperone [Klebsiella variicola]